MLLSGESSIIERKFVSFESAGVVEDGVYLLDGGNGWERDLLAGGGIEKVELGAGIGGDEPPVRRSDDVALPDGGIGETRLVGIFVGQAEDLGGAGGAAGSGVEEAGCLGADVDAEAAEGTSDGAPGSADDGGAEEVWELELTENGGEGVCRQVGPAAVGRR